VQVPPAEKQLLFVQKLHLCSFTFDFTDPTKHVREKEIKRQTLLELVDYANSGQGKFTEAVSEDIIFMLSQNLFRTLPPSRSHDVDNFDPEEEEPTLEPAWPHLQVGREIACRKWRERALLGGAMTTNRLCTVVSCRRCCCSVLSLAGLICVGELLLWRLGLRSRSWWCSGLQQGSS
jgi:hypothetical protein